MKKLFQFVFISASILVSSVLFAQEIQNYSLEENIFYRTAEEAKQDAYLAERCKLDIYYPENSENFTTVVWFHGGGIKNGKKHISEKLKNKGIAVVAVNYRLSPKVNCPVYIDDAAAAVAWTFKNIEKYGGDPAKIVVSGHSAGGYLTSMVGLDKSYLAKYQIDANNIALLIPFSGHTITHMTVRGEQGIKDTQPIVDKFAPLFHVRADAPPLVLITGDREREMLGRYEENAYMYRMMKVAGHTQTKLYELDAFNHGGMASPAFEILLQEIEHLVKAKSEKQTMMFGDTSRTGAPFSKDPHVLKFNGKFLMYFSIPPFADKTNPIQGWNIGIAESTDLINWEKIGEITPAGDYESKGLCAPCARVIDNKVHLFYQTYGNGKNDAICHAVSENGTDFKRNPTNPIFKPTGNWNCGRAIDAEVIKFKDQYLLYFATRDPEYKIQMQGVASAPANTSFNREDWTQISNEPMMIPEYDWEGKCVEGASVIQRGDELFMFYAGSYNNAPQQVGIAKSSDGVHWEKLSDQPFLPNGKPGKWNASESGHPHIFLDEDGKTYLFYQGNNTKGKDWFLSNIEVFWNENGPYLKK